MAASAQVDTRSADASGNVRLQADAGDLALGKISARVGASPNAADGSVALVAANAIQSASRKARPTPMSAPRRGR
jgi:hypothetical protein